MNAFDCLLLVSKSEGLSNALLEAMAAGCVPVASKVSGNVDLIEEGENGFLVENLVPSISEAISKAANMECSRLESMSVAARDMVRSVYSRPVVGDQLHALFSKKTAREI